MIAFLPIAALASFALQAGPCEFKASASPVAAAAISGPSEVTDKIRVIVQPDSPVAIAAADLTGTTLNVGPASFLWQGPYIVELVNTSDKVITDVKVALFVRAAPSGGGVGAGLTAAGPIEPGQRVKLSGRSGRGSGGAGTAGVTMDLFIESVRVGACEYRPSQRIPVVAAR